jgi:hypothetical protein
VTPEGPLARKRLKDQSHAPSSIMFQLEGPPGAPHSGKSMRNAAAREPQDLDKMVEDSAYRQMLPVVKRVRSRVFESIGFVVDIAKCIY